MKWTRSSANHGAWRASAEGVLALGLFALAGCQGAGARTTPAWVQAIEARNRQLEERFRAGNLLGVADVYADDAVLIDARGERRVGREEIDAYWSALEDPVDWRIEIRAIRGSDAIAYELGTSHLTTRTDGVPMISVTDFLLLWSREPGGEWRIELDAYWPREGR